jgi:anthranilate synthase component 2
MNLPKVVIFDNYDSFTWNLHHDVEALLGMDVPVIKNDEKDWNVLSASDLIILSPGPGLPETSGRLMECIATFGREKALLGVCLGHQALALHTGGTLFNLPNVWHGKTSVVEDALPEFTHVLQPFCPMTVGRYHSWAVEPTTLPEDWKVLQKTTEQVIMAMEHQVFPWMGVQYHPESILTERGREALLAMLTHLHQKQKKATE